MIKLLVLSAVVLAFSSAASLTDEGRQDAPACVDTIQICPYLLNGPVNICTRFETFCRKSCNACTEDVVAVVDTAGDNDDDVNNEDDDGIDDGSGDNGPGDAAADGGV
jgi:hypothetical protein